MDENNEVKVENSDEVTLQDYNEVKVQDSDEVIVQDFNTIKAEDSNEIKTDNNDIVQDATISNGIESNSYTYQENNEIKVENNNESQNKRKSLIIVAIILALILLGLVGYFVYDKFFKNKVESDNYTKEYYNLNDVKKEKITKEEFLSRVKKYNATCGVIGQKDNDGNPETCDNSNWFNYEAYIDNGTPYYMFNAQICDDEGACTNDEENFEVYNFSEIKNVKQIASKVDQYNGVEFAYELNNGDVYYFTPLFDEMTIDGSKHDTHLVKLNLPAKLKRFSNVSNGMITYGTEIVLELENNEKYVVEYNYETNKATLTKYDEYMKKVEDLKGKEKELSAKISNLSLDKSIIYSSKLDTIVKDAIFVSDNLSTDGKTFPEYAIINIDLEEDNRGDYDKFIIKSIQNPRVVLNNHGDGSDARYIDSYILDNNYNLYRVGFAVVDYEDKENHSLGIVKYNINNIKEIAYISGYEDSKILDETELYVTYNYVIVKTKDGKYYTDYSLDKDKIMLRQVVQDNTDYGTSITSEISEFKLDKSTLKSTNLNTIISTSKFISSNLSANTRYPSITAKNKNTKYTIKSINNPVAILYSDNDNSDGGFINAYIFDNKKNLYYASFSTKNSEDKENHDLKIYKFNVNNIVSYTLIKATSKDEMLTEVEDVYVPCNYVIFKTKDGKYYTDYSFDKDGMILRQVVQESNNTPAQNVSSVKCGDVDYDFSKDSVNEVKEGTGWSDGGVEIKYELSDKKLMYTLNDVTKQLNDLSCEKLFKYDNGSLSRSNDTNAIAAGICYTGSKYYEIGLTVDPSVGDRSIQATDFIPYADDITNLCK